MALKAKGGRLLSVIGDGSFQMTAQVRAYCVSLRKPRPATHDATINPNPPHQSVRPSIRPQEVSSMLRWGANPIILLLNNASYVIEEMIHRGDGYNSLQVGGMIGGRARRSHEPAPNHAAAALAQPPTHAPHSPTHPPHQLNHPLKSNNRTGTTSVSPSPSTTAR
jgi:hypothetical protein